MDCDHARLILAFDRPGELAPAERAALHQHIASCPECAAAVRISRRADEQFAKAIGTLVVPDGLRARLADRLSAARHAWYRSTVVRTAAACVASLLGLSLLYSVTRPALDLAAAAADANHVSGLWKPDAQARADADERLRLLGSRVPGPADFDYNNLRDILRAELFGVSSVPTLFFARGENYARVAILRDSQIRGLRGLDGQSGEDSGCWVSVRAVPDHPGWSYVITSYGKPLQFFLRRESGDNPA